MTRRLIVSYDVVKPSKRARVAKTLKGFMDRVQKSVFEGEVEERRLAELRERLQRIIDPETDSVRIYERCSRCRDVVEVLGVGIYVEREEDDIVV